MKTAPLAEVGANLSDYVERCHSGPVVLTRDGRPVAVLFGIGDDDELEPPGTRPLVQVRALLEKSRQEVRDGKGIPHDEFWKEFPRPGGGPSAQAAEGGREGRRPATRTARAPGITPSPQSLPRRRRAALRRPRANALASHDRVT